MSVETAFRNALGALVRTHGRDTPAYLREYARKEYAQQLLDFLAGVAMGDQTFPEVVVTGVRGGGQQYEVVHLTAPPMVRVRAAEILLQTAIPRQVGIVDDQDRGTGIIALPPLALDYARRMDPNISGLVEGAGLPAHPDGLEYVVIEEDISAQAAQGAKEDQPPPVPPATLNPDRVREVLARARRAPNGPSSA